MANQMDYWKCYFAIDVKEPLVEKKHKGSYTNRRVMVMRQKYTMAVILMLMKQDFDDYYLSTCCRWFEYVQVVPPNRMLILLFQSSQPFV